MRKIYFVFFLLINYYIQAQNVVNPVMEIAQRRVPWLIPYLDLKITKDSSKDFFNIETQKNKIRISANNTNSLARGLGHYLRFVAHRSLSHLGDNLSAPKEIIYPSEKITIISPFKYRYALNYCTLSYSMSFYTWKDWQKELDWMALNGINLMLAPLGTEIIWERTLQQLGYKKEETKNYIATPAFSAWWQMANLQGWQGKITDTIIEEQRQLAHLVFKQMKKLGIQPIYQGFYGNIPTSLRQKLPIKVIQQGKWAGGFQRPDFLNPEDKYFSKVANIYYSEIQKEYGNFQFFGGDPFHEGGRSENIDIRKAAEIIQKKMQEFFPNSIWILQGWGENPKEEILQGINKKFALILELEGENTANWQQRRSYNETPFIWCQISNFGAKTGLYGKIQHFSDEIYRAQNSEFSSFLSGIGIIPEGIHNNPVVYDFTLDLAWKAPKQHQKVKVQNWIKNYILYRYGNTHPNLERAWKLLLQTVYKSHLNYQQGAPESLLCARPALNLKSVSSWGTVQREYKYEDLKKAVQLFLSVEPSFNDSETYQTDKIDLLRQLNSDKSLILYHQIQKNIQNKDLVNFYKNRDKFLHLILLQDQLLSTNSHFRLDTFLKQALHSSDDSESKRIALRNAKTQITYWGTDSNINTNLRDYAHKEWNGILGSLYYKRWEAFFQWQTALLKGEKTTEPFYFSMEKEWADSENIYNIPSISKEKLLHIINEILNK